MTWTREDGYVLTLDSIRVSSRVLRIAHHGTMVFISSTAGGKAARPSKRRKNSPA